MFYGQTRSTKQVELRWNTTKFHLKAKQLTIVKEFFNKVPIPIYWDMITK